MARAAPERTEAKDPVLDHEERLESVIALYLEAAERGAPTPRSEVLAEHPDLADDLDAFFANQELISKLVAPLRDMRASLFESPWFGDYELLELIAEGGMGLVFKARQASLDRVVALKMIRAGRWATEEDMARFRLEASAAARLEHPGIMPIHEVGEHEGRLYFSMRFVEGGSLADQAALFAGRPHAAARLVAIAAAAIQHAHDHGILHRDLKPANILLAGEPGADLASRTPIVSDFGLAKRLVTGDDPSVTLSGSIVGTPCYMAPEQAARGPLTPAVDIYSLGAILYELLTGRPPFRARDALETLRQVREQEPERLRAIDPRVPRELETIVLACLEKAPERRYPSAAALALDLERWLAGAPIGARPASWPRRFIKSTRKHAILAAFVVIVGLTALASGAVARFREQVAHSEDALRAASADRARLAGELRDQQEHRRSLDFDAYLANLSAAQAALAGADPSAAQALLEACPVALRGWEWRHLERRLHPELYWLRGTSGLLCATEFLPGAAGHSLGRDKRRRSVWNSDPALDGSRIRGPDAGSYALAFDSTGERLATAGQDGLVKAWNLVNDALVFVVLGHQGWAGGVAWRPDGQEIASTGQDGVVRFWKIGPATPSAASPTPARVLRDGPKSAMAVRYSPDGGRVAVAGQDGGVWVWDLTTSPPRLTKIHGHDGEAAAIAWHPRGGLIASGGADRMVRVWDAASGKPILAFRAAPSRIHALAYSPDGTTLASAGLEHEIRQWNATTGLPVRVLPGHETPVLDLEFHPDGTRLLSASQDGTIKVWDLTAESGSRRLSFEDSATLGVQHEGSEPAGRGESSGGMAFRPMGIELAVGGRSRVVIWDSASGRVARVLDSPGGPTRALAYRPDGQRLAAARGDGRVQVWDLDRTGKSMVLGDARPGAASLAWGSGGLLAVGAGLPARMIQAPNIKVPALDDQPRAIQLWDVEQGRATVNLPGHRGSIHALAFSPDGKTLASAGADGLIRLWDHAAGRLALELPGHEAAVLGLAFSLDGSTLASAGADHTIRLWDAGSGGKIQTLARQDNWVESVAFSSDGSRLAAAGADETVRLWETTTWREVLTLRGPNHRIHAVAWGPDGKINLWHAAPVGP